MAKIVEKNSIKIGKEAVVILPLKEWKKIEELLDEWEDFIRYNRAISDPENQKLIPLRKVKRKLNLR